MPDFLTLLHGVIDSPDIPLNVSRSYLQSDSNVKKISTYITKKVSDRLQSIFKNDRKQFEEKWNDLKIFINYGMLTQEDFYDKAQKFALFTDTNDKHYTFEEYQTLIKDNQTDKDGNLIYLVDGLDLGASDFAYPGTSIEKEMIPYINQALSGKTIYSQKIIDTTLGHIFTACYPIKDPDGTEYVIDH